MNVFVCNIGSTSFKFRLFTMTAGREEECVHGAVEPLGSSRAHLTIARPGLTPQSEAHRVADHAAAIRLCLERLEETTEAERIDAVGFKAVHGGPLPAAVLVTDAVIETMQAFAESAPAHNPPYIAAMRAFARERPELPLVACFETGFHATIPEARRLYAIPHDWSESYGVRRWGFHGASHSYVASRTPELLGRRGLRIVSCHLGGSSSVSALCGTESLANSFGMTPQSGIPQNNRVGDLDPYALPVLRRRTGLSFEEILEKLACEGGLLGVSGLSNDMQVLLDAAAGGHRRARLAVDMYLESIRHYLGAFVVAMGGLDAIVFAGGIATHSAEIRRGVCRGLEFLGVFLDEPQNARARPDARISTRQSPVSVMVLETNEELIVARQTRELLQES